MLTFYQTYPICQDMGLPKKLTEMQIKFAQELVTNEGRKTATDITASELQSPKRYPLVVQYIGKIRSDYQKKYEVTYERHISELAKLREDSRKKGAWSAAINAEVARGKAAGLYVEQKIIRTGKLDDLSEEELDKRISETLDEFSPILEGVTADELKSNVKEKQKELRLDNKKDNTQPLDLKKVN